MYPPVGIGQGRICTSHDTIVGGHLHLPAGTCVAMPHHTIHNASFNWDDHDKFLPGEALLLFSWTSLHIHLDTKRFLLVLWSSC